MHYIVIEPFISAMLLRTDIYAFVNCGPSLSWYDSAGRVDVNALKGLLTEHSVKVSTT